MRNRKVPIFAVVGRGTPVGALYSLFRYLSAVLVEYGNEVEGIITEIDLLASGDQVAVTKLV